MKNNEFDVKTVPLNGSNLIEASAGTGKTYSIGILVLRFLLEKRVGLNQMLLVTYTNAAVAELEIRIRKFIREAYRIAKARYEHDEEIKKSDFDEKILSIVEQQVEKWDEKRVYEILDNALLDIDETAIFTIHSFCQRTLSEFSFETKQLFSVEVIENQAEFIDTALFDYWRKHITTLEKPLLEMVLKAGVSMDLIRQVVNKKIDGYHFVDTEMLSDFDTESILTTGNDKQKKWETAQHNYETAVVENWNRIKDEVKGAGQQRKLKNYINTDNKTAFLDEFKFKYVDGKVAQNETVELGFLKPFVEELLNAEAELEKFYKQVRVYHLNTAADAVIVEVERRKANNAVLSFHDLIARLHQVVMQKDNLLVHKLQKKYKAVFIDEFQDTDRLQYEIFNRVFGKNTGNTVFYIGDPKQSIYGWRGADLNTYIKASKEVEKGYTMNTNYRSVIPLVKAMNSFFGNGHCNGKPADAFCSKEITYNAVEAYKDSENQCVDANGEEASVFDIISVEKSTKDDMMNGASNEIKHILSHCLLKGNPVKPSNIAVLVRTNADAKAIKTHLSKKGIPAVVVDDKKVIDTEEARDLYFFLYAILEPSQTTIARALYSVFTGFTKDKLRIIDYDRELSYFIKMKRHWQENGVYSLILNFMAHYEVKKNLLAGNNTHGDRVYANLLQLAEILNRQMIENQYSPEKLLSWFKKAREGFSKVEAYEQRIESDQEAVQIVTVHRSKGLAYNIVVLPYFNLNFNGTRYNNIQFAEYYDTEQNAFVFSLEKEAKKDCVANREEHENRRLLYVAVTRAVYKCVLVDNGKSGVYRHFITPDLEKAKNIVLKQEFTVPEHTRYVAKTDSFVGETTPLPFTKTIDRRWRLASYSALDSHQYHEKSFDNTQAENANDYDRFIFSQLPKGALSGNLLHQILEEIDFTQQAEWEGVVLRLLKRYGKPFSDFDTAYFTTMLAHIVEADLQAGTQSFSLNIVPQTQRFSELEFFYRMKQWQPAEIRKLLGNAYAVQLTDEEINGIMHGYIDLLFEHNGKFYVLDWKSNFLGYSIQDYNPTALQQAMTDSNYHLQYLVYTVAVQRYLKHRLPDYDYNARFGGVFYLFLRGLRKGKQNGVFFHKPPKETIETLDDLLGK
jgi:exodeoxyribonuclease V beta subunit